MWIDKRLLILIVLVSSFAFGQRSRSYILAGQGASCTAPNAANTNAEEYQTGTCVNYCGDEADVVPTWSGYAPVACTYTSEADTSSGYGDYVGYVVATGTSNGRARHRFGGLTASTTYEWVVSYKKTQGTAGRITISGDASNDGEPTGLASTTWTEQSGEFTTDGTPTTVEIGVWGQTTSGGSAGDDIYYKLSVKEQ